MGAKVMGWQRSPAVEKVTGGPAGSMESPGTRVVGEVSSLSREEGSKQGEGRGRKGDWSGKVKGRK